MPPIDGLCSRRTLRVCSATATVSVCDILAIALRTNKKTNNSSNNNNNKVGSKMRLRAPWYVMTVNIELAIAGYRVEYGGTRLCRTASACWGRNQMHRWTCVDWYVVVLDAKCWRVRMFVLFSITSHTFRYLTQTRKCFYIFVGASGIGHHGKIHRRPQL